MTFSFYFFAGFLRTSVLPKALGEGGSADLDAFRKPSPGLDGVSDANSSRLRGDPISKALGLRWSRDCFKVAVSDL